MKVFAQRFSQGGERLNFHEARQTADPRAANQAKRARAGRAYVGICEHRINLLRSMAEFTVAAGFRGTRECADGIHGAFDVGI